MKLKIDTESQVPRYLQLAEQIRTLIGKNKLGPGSQLWSERQLVKECGVSLSTVRKTYEILIDEGLVVKRQGSGAYVADLSRKDITVRALLDQAIYPKKVWHEIIAEFNKEYPYIKLECLFANVGSDYELLLSGFKPDIFSINESRFFNSEIAEYLTDLTPLYVKDKVDTKTCFAETQQCFKEKKCLYAAPYRFSTNVLFFNKTLFKKYGVTEPDNNSTWQEILEKARELTIYKQNGCAKSYGYGVNLRIGYLSSIISQNCKNGKNPPLKNYFEKEEVRGALKFWIEDMLFKYKVSPPPFSQDSVELFANNKLAMIAGKYNYAQEFRRSSDLDWGIAELPESQAKASSIAVQALALSSKSTVRDSAWEFIKFVSSEQVQEKFKNQGWGLPTCRESAEKMPDSAVYIASLHYAKAAWLYRYDKLCQVIQDELKMLLARFQTTDITCNKISRAWKKMQQ
ncbi:MAG: extracellular solute-binding protein [Planctomycetota bacterium]|jgi:ABC-type glycerol-3-phosphate transport system substrate-binding protein